MPYLSTQNLMNLKVKIYLSEELLDKLRLWIIDTL